MKEHAIDSYAQRNVSTGNVPENQGSWSPYMMTTLNVGLQPAQHDWSL